MSLAVLATGCTKKVDITNNDLGVESCDRYFELMDCILENDDEKYSEEMRNELREDVIAIQEEWKDLDKEFLDETCTAELEKFESISDSLNEIGCPIN